MLLTPCLIKFGVEFCGNLDGLTKFCEVTHSAENASEIVLSVKTFAIFSCFLRS